MQDTSWILKHKILLLYVIVRSCRPTTDVKIVIVYCLKMNIATG